MTKRFEAQVRMIKSLQQLRGHLKDFFVFIGRVDYETDKPRNEVAFWSQEQKLEG